MRKAVQYQKIITIVITMHEEQTLTQCGLKGLKIDNESQSEGTVNRQYECTL